MNVEEILSKTINELMDKRLDNAIEVLNQLFLQRPSLMGSDEFEAVKRDYQLMVDYMGRGLIDSQRASLYASLLQRLYRVTTNLEIGWRCKHVPAYIDAFRISNHLNTSHDFIRTVLESFVSDLAMLSLQSETTPKDKENELYDRHQLFINRLFNALFTSCQWTEEDYQFYSQLLTSPTVISTDQQLLVSAITLSAMNQFDINKFKTLTTVYQHTNDSHVRQRALVGWVLSVFEGMDIFPEQDNIIKQLCTDANVTRDLLSLQIQLFYSQDTEKDNDKIQRDIMPDIIRNSNLTVGRLGIVEKEEDQLENILHQDAEDKRMEQMEEQVKKMMDMQKQGSDIYFGGFRQMKSFPFFGDLVNWFTPFYIENPALRPALKALGDSKFLDVLVNKGSLCESDKYSLVIAMERVINQLPSNIKEMMGTDSAFGPLGSFDERENAANIRRAYIQDLYRFFRLYKTAQDLINPFEDNGKGDFVADTFFFIYKSFMGTGLDAMKLRLALHLYNHHQYRKLIELLSTFYSDDLRYNILVGYTNIHLGRPDTAYEFFSKALENDPTNEWALKGLARAALDCEDYETAEQTYAQLLRLDAENKSFALNRSVALLKLGKSSEVREELFRLDYQYPDDMNVKRVFAWAMLMEKSLDKAEQLYNTLLEASPTTEDYLNAGYCQWAKGNVQQAAELFRNWITKGNKDRDQLLDEFKNDAELLEKCNIQETDWLLMLTLAKPL